MRPPKVVKIHCYLTIAKTEDSAQYTRRPYQVAQPKEQPPRKLSGKRTVNINSGKRKFLADGVNLSGS